MHLGGAGAKGQRLDDWASSAWTTTVPRPPTSQDGTGSWSAAAAPPASWPRRVGTCGRSLGGWLARRPQLHTVLEIDATSGRILGSYHIRGRPRISWRPATASRWRPLSRMSWSASPLPVPPSRYGGRPRVDDWAALAGIVYQLRTGVPWRLLPTHQLGCGSPVTCWRRLGDWQRAGVWQRLHHVLLDHLGRKGQLDWSRASVDSLSVRAKRGAS